MNIIDASVILISGLFGLYAVFSGFEYGIVLKMLSQDKSSRSSFTPLWEITNVFLIFGITALVMLFNGALPRLSQGLMATLGVALVVMLARACLVLSIFYIKDSDQLPGWLLWPFASATLLVPLCFAAGGIYLLSGHLFWQNWLGAGLIVCCLSGLLAIGLSFVNRRANQAGRALAGLAFAAWMLLLGSVLPLINQHLGGHLGERAMLALSVLALAGLGWLLLGYVTRVSIKLWPYAALVGLLVPAILAWANRPYLVHGQLTLHGSYGAQTYGWVILAGVAIMAPLIIAGLFMFAKLLDVLDR